MSGKAYILVVDDDHDILEMVERVLRLEEYEVGTAIDGETGLAMIEERQPDLVILDIMLPGIDGFQVLNLIRKRSDVPVIMLTARSETPIAGDALDLGADDYVRKPFAMRELLARIKAKLRRTSTGT